MLAYSLGEGQVLLGAVACVRGDLELGLLCDAAARQHLGPLVDDGFQGPVVIAVGCNQHRDDEPLLDPSRHRRDAVTGRAPSVWKFQQRRRGIRRHDARSLALLTLGDGALVLVDLGLMLVALCLRQGARVDGGQLLQAPGRARQCPHRLGRGVRPQTHAVHCQLGHR